MIEQYLATQKETSEQRQWAKDLHNRVSRQHAAHRTAREQGDAKPQINAIWELVWGRRSSTEVENDNKVRRGLVKWAAESGKWNDILPGRKVNGTTSKAQSTAPLYSTPNTYMALSSANLDDSSDNEVTPATPQAKAPLSSTPNTYMALSSGNLDDSSESEVTPGTNNNCDSEVTLNSRQKKELKKLKRLNVRMKKLALNADEEKFWDQAMNQASDERTYLDKVDDNNIYRVSVTEREQKMPAAPSIR